jgi:hypothetical protein
MRSDARSLGYFSALLSTLTLALGPTLLGGCDKMRGGSEAAKRGPGPRRRARAASVKPDGAGRGHHPHRRVRLAHRLRGDVRSVDAQWHHAGHRRGQSAAGGVRNKKIAVKTYDDQGKSQEAGTVVTRLITEDKVVAILGEVASSLSIAGGRVAQQYGVPMISPSSTNPQVTQIGDMIFRCVSSTRTRASSWRSSRERT